MSRAGAGFRSLTAPQWKAPLSPAASAGVSKEPLCFQETPPQRKLCLRHHCRPQEPGTRCCFGPGLREGGWGVGSGYQDLGHVQEAEEAARQGATTPIPGTPLPPTPINCLLAFPSLRPSPIPALTGTQFRKRDETWEWWEAGSGEKQRLEAGGLF